MQTEIIKNIEKIKERINSACSKGDIEPRNLTLVAVSKKKSHELIEIALQNGIYNFGENYAQELVEKSKLINSDKIISNWLLFIFL